MAKSTAGIGPKGQRKVAAVMHEWKGGDLHSGSKRGPVVKSQPQAVAIALTCHTERMARTRNSRSAPFAARSLAAAAAKAAFASTYSRSASDIGTSSSP
jgi:hypothetical protein